MDNGAGALDDVKEYSVYALEIDPLAKKLDLTIAPAGKDDTSGGALEDVTCVVGSHQWTIGVLANGREAGSIGLRGIEVALTDLRAGNVQSARSVVVENEISIVTHEEEFATWQAVAQGDLVQCVVEKASSDGVGALARAVAGENVDAGMDTFSDGESDFFSTADDSLKRREMVTVDGGSHAWNHVDEVDTPGIEESGQVCQDVVLGRCEESGTSQEGQENVLYGLIKCKMDDE